MVPARLFRKFVKFIRGGATPWQIAASCLLGVAIGMVPGFNATVLLLIGLFVLLNLNLGLMLVGLVVGKALCLVLAPITFQVGYVIIHGMGLEGLFRVFSEAPILAWMDLHYYCLVGGIPVALIVGGVLGALLGRLIGAARAAIVAGGEKSERFQRITKNILVRLLLRLLFGKQKGNLADMLAGRAPVFRKSGVIVCVAVVVLVLAGEILFADRAARAGIVRGLQAATGAEVNVERVGYRPLTGRLEVVGLQVTDPNKPTHNMVQIDTLTSDVSVRDLLSRRFVMDEMLVDRAETDVKRESPGEVFVKLAPPAPPVADAALDKYFRSGRKILDFVRKTKEYFDREAEKQQEGETAEDLRRRAELKGYHRLSARSVLARRPKVTFRRLVIANIPGASGDTYRIEGAQVSDSPLLTEEPMVVVVTNSRVKSVAVMYNFSEPGGLPQLKLGGVKDIVADVVGVIEQIKSDSDEGKTDQKPTADKLRELFR